MQAGNPAAHMLSGGQNIALIRMRLLMPSTCKNRKERRKNQMSDQTESKRMVVQLPKSLFSKVEEAASRDYTSVSDICRRALASDSRVRGLLADDEGEVIA
jgi:hypothetical protein